MISHALLSPIRIFAVTILVGLTGCAAVGPTYQKPEPELPAQWAEGGGTSAMPVVALDTWWTQFKDPLLDSLVRRAIAANHDLRLADTRLREARAQRQLAGAARVPAINASSAYSKSRSYENTQNGDVKADLYQVGFDAGWEIDIFGGVRRSIEAADASVAVSEEDRRDVLVTLMGEVARNYLELRGSQQRLVIARKNIANQQETVQLVEKRAEIGLSGELEVEQAKNQLYLTKSRATDIETTTRQTMHRMALLLGEQPQALVAELSPEALLPAAPPEIPLTLPSDLLRRRPDIRRAERQLAAATAEVGVATAELFPRFSLGLLGGLQSQNLSDLVTSGSRFWSLGPTVKWSLFDGGRARAGVEVQDARRERAEIGYEKTVLAALGDVENALVALALEKENRKNLGAAVVSAQRAASLAGGQYQLGLVDFLNVLQTETSLSQSEDQLVQSDQRLATNVVSLFKALGGGWDPAAEETSRMPSRQGPSSPGVVVAGNAMPE